MKNKDRIRTSGFAYTLTILTATTAASASQGVPIDLVAEGVVAEPVEESVEVEAVKEQAISKPVQIKPTTKNTGNETVNEGEVVEMPVVLPSRTVIQRGPEIPFPEADNVSRNPLPAAPKANTPKLKPLPEIADAEKSINEQTAAVKETSLYYNFGVTDARLSTESDEVVLTGASSVAALSLDEGPIEGSGASVAGDKQPSITIGYRFKSIDGLAFETAIAPPLEFALSLTGTVAEESIAPFALCPANCVATGIPALGPKLGTVKVLPALATLTYRAPTFWRFQPYLGAGFTFVYTFDPVVTNETLTGSGDPTLSLKPALGAMLQFGFDTQLTDKLTLVADIKVSSKIDVTGKIENISLESPTLSDVIGPARIDEASVDTALTATVYNLSLRYRW